MTTHCLAILPRSAGLRRLPWAILGALVTGLAGWALWYALAWTQFRREGAPGQSTAAVDRMMPVYEIAERHEILVDAPAAVTLAAARALDLERVGVIHAIFAGRRLLLAPEDTAGGRLTLNELEAMGWGRLVETSREIVFGSVSQPWRDDVQFRSLPPETFAAFDSAGYVKIIWTLAVDSLAPGRSRFRTETRALTTDATSRKRFRRYWSALSPGIVLIRWQVVRRVRADAERRLVAPP